MSQMSPGCPHFQEVERVPPRSTVCEQCVALGDSWVHLRACLTCGQVGCCDSSKNRHASKHFRETGHPLVQSMEPGERWVFCYIDQIVVEQ